MTVKLANMPVYCAGCMNQQPNLRHVDFDAALDRGYGKDEAVKVAMDDAIFCENCVKEGAELFGMINEKAWAYEKDQLERQRDMAFSLRDKAERAQSTLEDLAMQRGAKIDRRKLPKERQPVG